MILVNGKRVDPVVRTDGTVVIRPDSGDPFSIICGDLNAINRAEHKGVLKLLWDIFGGTYNDAGFKVLNPKIGIIYGDAITEDVMQRILREMLLQGFASSNVTFGIGSYSYQYVTRDTFGFAMKATSAVIEGKRVSIQKDPITGSGKRSAKGLLCVKQHGDSLELIENVSEGDEKTGLLNTVFENGEFRFITDISVIRKNVNNELRKIKDWEESLMKDVRSYKQIITEILTENNKKI